MINNDKKIIALQNKIVDRMLIDIPKLGLNEKTLILAAKNCNISEGYLGRLLPEGMSDFKKIFFSDLVLLAFYLQHHVFCIFLIPAKPCLTTPTQA